MPIQWTGIEVFILPFFLSYNGYINHEDYHCRGSITPEMALRLELAFKKPSADHWLRLQNAYDLWLSRQNLAELHVQPYKIAS